MIENEWIITMCNPSQYRISYDSNLRSAKLHVTELSMTWQKIWISLLTPFQERFEH